MFLIQLRSKSNQSNADVFFRIIENHGRNSGRLFPAHSYFSAVSGFTPTNISRNFNFRNDKIIEIIGVFYFPMIYLLEYDLSLWCVLNLKIRGSVTKKYTTIRLLYDAVVEIRSLFCI